MQGEKVFIPKVIDFKEGWFMANGRKYTISQTFTIERFALYQQYESELGYGTTFEAIFQTVDGALADLNKLQLVDGIVKLTDMQRGMAIIEEKEPFVLKICALAMNVEGEDVRVMTDDMITLKINDWKIEGISMECFFRYALSTMAGFSDLYNQVTASISALGRIKNQSDL